MSGSRIIPPGMDGSDSSVDAASSDGSFASTVQSSESDCLLSAIVSVNQLREEMLHVMLDADGCVYNKEYHANKYSYYFKNPENLPREKFLFSNMCASNDVLNNYLTNQFNHFRHVIISNGSIRQTFFYDCLAVNQNTTNWYWYDLPEYTSFLQKQARHDNVTFDSISMRDLQKHLFPGQTYSEIRHNSQPHENDVEIDPSKANFVYAKAHRAIIEANGKNATLLMLDDHEQILDKLYVLYHNNPRLLPQGLSLALVRYDGAIQKEYKLIIGEGKLDRDYARNAQNMVYYSTMIEPDYAQLDVASIFCLPGVANQFISFIEGERQLLDKKVDKMSDYKGIFFRKHGQVAGIISEHETTCRVELGRMGINISK